MNNDKNEITRIPITYNQRKQNQYGDGYVPCDVSPRWLQFHNQTAFNNHIFVDVMTTNEENNIDRKICELCISIDDILRALNNAKNNS